MNIERGTLRALCSMINEGAHHEVLLLLQNFSDGFRALRYAIHAIEEERGQLSPTALHGLQELRVTLELEALSRPLLANEDNFLEYMRTSISAIPPVNVFTWSTSAQRVLA